MYPHQLGHVLYVGYNEHIHLFPVLKSPNFLNKVVSVWNALPPVDIDQRRRNVLKAGGAEETITNLKLLVVNYIMFFIDSVRAPIDPLVESLEFD